MFNNELLLKKRSEKRIMPGNLAKMLNISTIDYMRFENGTTIPSGEVLDKLCEILEIQNEDLFKENKIAEEIKSKTKIISVFSNKGGVGKTTSTVHLAEALTVLKKKVLIVDFDGQGNSTIILNGELNDEKNVYNLMRSGSEYTGKPEKCIQKTRIEGLDIISGSKKIYLIQAGLMIEEYSDKLLLNYFTDLIKSEIYDYILFDNGPNVSNTLTNTIYCCNYVIAPVDLSDQQSIDGLDEVFDRINFCIADNTMFEDLRILINKYDRRCSHLEAYEDTIKENFKDYVFKTKIRINASIQNAYKYGQTVFNYDKNSKGAEDFLKLAKEIIRTLK